ncbi:adenylyl-sulfate kinase [Cupriavidus basilensis]|uniref:Adenylyl-sulfate kinase n=1 Tax=Cupriavidus basilensis TaxID=68895 RepID=A0ABT6AZN3_9BURK|nr:adenylyl-sulfate kinase [Cupriavidus basilensis]MDF3838084.1 adenylyl-sulfate kinase [Cupriavidus basilensis]
MEAHVDTSLAEFELRYPKGLYAKARQGLIQKFTGLDSPYKVPLKPDLKLDTSHKSIEYYIAAMLNHLEARIDISLNNALHERELSYMEAIR